jgi:DNA repair protein RadC
LLEHTRTVEDIDFEFENAPVKIVMLRDFPELKMVERTIGPFKDGQEVETNYWIAKELVKSGVAKFRDEDLLNLVVLSKIHWRETIPTSRQIPQLREDFYPMLRRFLSDLKAQSQTDQSKGKEFEKALQLSRDIVNCRIKKIVSMAAAPEPPGDITRNMAAEERALYNELSNVIKEWREKILF